MHRYFLPEHLQLEEIIAICIIYCQSRQHKMLTLFVGLWCVVLVEDIPL